MADKYSGCRCCACSILTLDSASDWIVDSGTLTESSGVLQFDGEFTPNSTVAAEAFAIVLYDVDGYFTFTIDSVDYIIDMTTETDEVTISADGNTKTLVRGAIGDLSKKIAVQIRITPTHAFIVAVESDTVPVIGIDDNTVQLVGDLYAMVTCELSSPATGAFTLAGIGDIDRIRVATSTPTCFVPPDLGSAYYAYVALGGVENEGIYPGEFYLSPNCNAVEPMPHVAEHVFSGNPGEADAGLMTNGFGNGFITIDPDKRAHYVDTEDRFGFAKFSGNAVREYTFDGSGGSSFYLSTGISIQGEIYDKWPESTSEEPYPMPVYEIELRCDANFNQPYPALHTTAVYVLDSPDPASTDPDDGLTIEEVPINSLAAGSTTIEAGTTTYVSTNPNPPSTYPSLSITRWEAVVTGELTV